MLELVSKAAAKFTIAALATFNVCMFVANAVAGAIA